MQQQIHLNEVLNILELPQNSWKLNIAKNQNDAEMILAEFKDAVKKQHRILVKKYHPDIPKNKKEGDEKIKKINAMIDVVNNLKIIPPQRRPQITRIRVYTGFSGTSTTDSSTSTSSFTFS